MYGWRARIGVLIPTTNTIVEAEFNRLAPEGVSIHASRMNLRQATVRDLEKMNTYIERAAKRLTPANVDVIAFVGTSASLLKMGIDEEIAERIRRVANKPAVVTSTAAVDALKTLGLTEVSVATPYIDEVNERVKSFLEGHGFKVLNLRGRGLRSPIVMGEDYPSSAYKLAKEAYTPQAEGIFISCTGWRGLDAIQRLEDDLNKPVVTANQATFWAILKTINVKTSIEGYGVLLRDYVSSG